MKKHTHIGVYALIQKENQVLLIKKSRGAYIGKWDLPGGGFNHGEIPTKCLTREVLEETGLNVSSYNLLEIMSHNTQYLNSNQEMEDLHHIGIIYKTQTSENSNSLKTTGDGEDSLGAKWHTISELTSENLSPFAERVILSSTK